MTARLIFLPLAILLVLAPHAWATVPTFGKQIKWGPKKGVLSGTSALTVVASVNVDGYGDAYQALRIRVPKSGDGQVMRTWILYGKTEQLNNGKAFPLAKLQTTVDFTLLNEKGYDRIWDYDFDRYFNICLKKGYEVSASGGNLYCDVHYARDVEYRQTTRVTKQYPRPKVISTTETWPSPICEVGATSVDTTSSPVEDISRVCHDGVSEYNGTYGLDGFVNRVSGCGSRFTYPRTTTVVARIPQVRGRPRTNTTSVTDCDQDDVKGPGWVETSRTPLPAPAVTVTSIEGPIYGGYTVRGTLVSNYRKECTIAIYVVTADGVSRWAANSLVKVTPGQTHTWSASGSFDGQTPTSAASGIATAGC